MYFRIYDLEISAKKMQILYLVSCLHQLSDGNWMRNSLKLVELSEFLELLELLEVMSPGSPLEYSDSRDFETYKESLMFQNFKAFRIVTSSKFQNLNLPNYKTFQWTLWESKTSSILNKIQIDTQHDNLRPTKHSQTKLIDNLSFIKIQGFWMVPELSEIELESFVFQFPLRFISTEIWKFNCWKLFLKNTRGNLLGWEGEFWKVDLKWWI